VEESTQRDEHWLMRSASSSYSVGAYPVTCCLS